MTRIIPGGMADGKESLPRQFMADILPASFNSQDCASQMQPSNNSPYRTFNLYNWCKKVSQATNEGICEIVIRLTIAKSL